MAKMVMEILKFDIAWQQLDNSFRKQNEYISALQVQIKTLYNDLFVALKKAAQEAYHSEVVETGMEDSWVGTGKEFSSKEDWMEQRIEEWLS